jgi:hypothetical protein
LDIKNAGEGGEEMTKAEAKKWCIAKWEYIVENNGNEMGLEDAIPELDRFNSECAYCEKYRKIDGKISLEKDLKKECTKCPLLKIKKGWCFGENSLFSTWDDTPTEQNAQKMLDAIRRS